MNLCPPTEVDAVVMYCEGAKQRKSFLQSKWNIENNIEIEWNVYKRVLGGV